ncbi:ABC transporter ATP-binding protein [Agilicoccus flavus]|uniref:ABC transporter ATP-binding protein n=1 Tax=Agilicoccus flavus TaxID=2775968 RepID=UPI001CF64693|nr:ABC transporter ATP-binding protein [Agilicoccus flavus]
MRRNRRSATGGGGDLHLQALTKRFGSFTAVDALDLRVPQGSFFALLGPSGCGKSTTLRMVAGLETPTAGRIRIGESDVTASRPFDRPVNTVFQSYALFPHLDVRGNVEFGPRRRKVADAAAQAQAALELVAMDHLAAARPAQLSGGQAQRVALARALVNRPEVLLLDEPLAALDLTLRRRMQGELKRIQHEVGITFVHVTHDQEEAMSLADTVAVMNAGRIEQMGSPTALYDLPRTAFVAGFLGRTNLADGTILGRDGDWVVVQVGAHRVWLDRARCAEPDAPARSAVRVGIRPEKLRLHRVALGEEPPRGGFTAALGPATVVDISFTGVSTEYALDLPGIGGWRVFEQNLDIEDEDLRPGDEVVVSWDSRHAFGLSGRDEPASSSATEEDLVGAPGVIR